ncbi:hypothetical protein AOR04_02700 [Pseudoalteromonas sp. 1_2015MBL_MicDiv]|nr:hypothetical protein AOR04_02700 [Pseudoalteromonas sp. 1_2015MBL_MicDiv]
MHNTNTTQLIKRGVKPHLQYVKPCRCEFTSRSCKVAWVFKKRGINLTYNMRSSVGANLLRAFIVNI